MYLVHLLTLAAAVSRAEISKLGSIRLFDQGEQKKCLTLTTLRLFVIETDKNCPWNALEPKSPL